MSLISEANKQRTMSGSKLDNHDLLDEQRAAKQAEPVASEPLPVFKALQEVKNQTGNTIVSFILHFNIV